jgi:hypothetical protein
MSKEQITTEDLKTKGEALLRAIEGHDIKELKKWAKHYDKRKYPDLNFSITSDKIQNLIDLPSISLNWELLADKYRGRIDNDAVLIRLLISTLWKRGDLCKIDHIVEGILNEKSSTDRVVFWHFGKHLADPFKNPIIDINIINFWLWAESGFKGHLSEFRFEPHKIERKHIEDYINFFSNNVDRFDEKEISKYEYSRLIDKAIFGFVRPKKKKADEGE